MSTLAIVFIGHHRNCGGLIRIRDWRTAADRDFRYEAWCEKCRACDPNGYSSAAKTIEGAGAYFKVSSSPAFAPSLAEGRMG